MEALQELEIAYQACLEVAAEKGKPLPMPGALSQISHAAKLLNISELARQSGLNVQTLNSKIKRGTELQDNEKQAVTSALQQSGIILLPA